MDCCWIDLPKLPVKGKSVVDPAVPDNEELGSVEQTTPASSLCSQLWVPQADDEQSAIEFSPPVHSTSSSQIRPEPGPNDRETPPLNTLNTAHERSSIMGRIEVTD